MTDNFQGMSAAASSSTRVRRDPLPTTLVNDEDVVANVNDDDDQEHCTICLQPFLNRAILPACAHEFCFECILLWSEQSRKCPLCARSFDDSYLIHHIRSQYDYQKHYLPPQPRSSPPPLLAGASHVNALRNTRRERQWGRRQRQQREEADQLERAVAQRRWIYQYHLYAKHVASNPFTRYRPFPTPMQFSASPDLISRMTTFLRRELRVWPNLDVEFLTTYTISLMKSIDIRSEAAVKLLSEFLDLDTPYTAGARHVNAEHFVHEIYSYLRSPYRDLGMYDRMAQYDVPSEIHPPPETERGSRWSAESSPHRGSCSPSNSRYPSLVSLRESRDTHSPGTRHGRDSSADALRGDTSNHRHDPYRSPRGRDECDSRNQASRTRHNPFECVQDTLSDGHSGRVSHAAALNSSILAENQDNDSLVEQQFNGDKTGNDHAMEETVTAMDTPKLNTSLGDDPVVVNEAGVTRLGDGPLEVKGDNVANYVDDVCGGSSANAHSSRKRLAGLSVDARRNRTLSESIQTYLSRPATPWHLRKNHPIPGDRQSTQTLNVGTSYTPPGFSSDSQAVRPNHLPTDFHLATIRPSRTFDAGQTPT